MRKVFDGLAGVERDPQLYGGILPEELPPFYAWIPDAGHSIACVPASLSEKPFHEMPMHEVPVPVAYVLERGWTKVGDHIFVDVEYSSSIGLLVDERYHEHDKVFYPVGARYSRATMMGEGIALNFPCSGGILIHINMDRPSGREVRDWSADSLQIGCGIINDIFFLCAKVEGQDWLDAPFDPIAPGKALSGLHEGCLTLILTDQRRGEIRVSGRYLVPAETMKVTGQMISAAEHDRRRFVTKLDQCYAALDTAKKIYDLCPHKVTLGKT